MVTITVPTKIKIPYGETVLPRGLQVEVVSSTASAVTVRYLGDVYTIPSHPPTGLSANKS